MLVSYFYFFLDFFSESYLTEPIKKIGHVSEFLIWPYIHEVLNAAEQTPLVWVAEVAQGWPKNFVLGLASTETWSFEPCTFFLCLLRETGPDFQTKHHPKDVYANMFDNSAVC